MAENRKKRDHIVTPQGVAAYPYLTKGEPNTKFTPEYKVTLIIPKAEAAGLIAELQPVMDESKEEAKEKVNNRPKDVKALVAALPFTEQEDDNDQPTGNLLFTFKLKASITSKTTGKTWVFTPKVFDAKGLPVTEKVWGGSIIKVAFRPRPWFFAASKQYGVALDMDAVQVLELVTEGSGTAEAYGFDTDGEGFESSGVTAPSNQGAPARDESEPPPEDTEGDGDEYDF